MRAIFISNEQNSVRPISLFFQWLDHVLLSIWQDLTLLSLGGKGVIFARSKFKVRLFLIILWYEPETLWLFLTFTRDYFVEIKNWKNIKFSGDKKFLYREYCQKIGVRICRNSFSRRNKYVHAHEFASTSSFNFLKRLRSTVFWPVIIIYSPDLCKLQTNKQLSKLL